MFPRKVMMPYSRKHQQKYPKIKRVSRGLVGVLASIPEQEVTSLCSPSSSSSSSSCNSLTMGNRKDACATEMLDSLQCPQRTCSFLSAIASTMCTQSNEASSNQEKEGPGTSQGLQDTESLVSNTTDVKVVDLVEFLLLKYRMKEPVTKAEMLRNVTKNYQEQFPEIFSKASECMQLVFGIEVKEMDPYGHSYALSIALGLTYDGMLNDERSMPKTGLLINILVVIFLDGNCTSEEVVWEVLNVMEVYSGSEHFIYGEPRKLITEDFVQEQYLEYRRVPSSDPARYEFLWGPRARAETSKMKVLEFLATINDTSPSTFSNWYEEALRDEEGDQGRVAAMPSGVTRARAYSKVTSTNLSHLK